jgi:hypothetical protein
MEVDSVSSNSLQTLSLEDSAIEHDRHHDAVAAQSGQQGDPPNIQSSPSHEGDLAQQLDIPRTTSPIQLDQTLPYKRRESSLHFDGLFAARPTCKGQMIMSGRPAHTTSADEVLDINEIVTKIRHSDTEIKQKVMELGEDRMYQRLIPDVEALEQALNESRPANA